MLELGGEPGAELVLEPYALDGPVLDRLWQRYTHDLSESRHTLPLRRRGVGQAVALELIGRYLGTWEIAFQGDNPGAPAFWRGVATTLVGDAWREERRPVPNKPDIPPDHWLLFDTSP